MSDNLGVLQTHITAPGDVSCVKVCVEVGEKWGYFFEVHFSCVYRASVRVLASVCSSPVKQAHT